MKSLFDHNITSLRKSNAPLADRMRPRTLDEFVGQGHILAKGRLLRRAIQADQLTRLIFYGPPGTGTTTLAQATPKPIFCPLTLCLQASKIFGLPLKRPSES